VPASAASKKGCGASAARVAAGVALLQAVSEVAQPMASRRQHRRSGIAVHPWSSCTALKLMFMFCNSLWIQRLMPSDFHGYLARELVLNGDVKGVH